MNSPVKEAKLQADRLSDRLRELGVNIKRTQALEGVAAVHNFTDWNRYESHLERIPAPSAPTSPAGQSLATIAAADNAAATHRIIMLRPGDGKSSILALMLADEIQTGHGIPLWINCVDGTPNELLPSNIVQQVTIIEASFDGDNLMMPPPPQDPQAIYISLRGPRASSTEGRSERTRAFCAMAEAITSTWPSALQEAISFVLIDETNALDAHYPPLFQSAIPALAMKRAQVLYATQHLQEVPASPLPLRVLSSRPTLDKYPRFDAKDHVVEVLGNEWIQPVNVSRSSGALDVFAAAQLVTNSLARRPSKIVGDIDRKRLLESLINWWAFERKAVTELDSFFRIAKQLHHIVISGESDIRRNLSQKTDIDWRTLLAQQISASDEIRLWCTTSDLDECRDSFMQALRESLQFADKDAKTICNHIFIPPSPLWFIESLKHAGLTIKGEDKLLKLLDDKKRPWWCELDTIIKTSAKHGYHLIKPDDAAVNMACHAMRAMRLPETAMAAVRSNSCTSVQLVQASEPPEVV